MSTAEYRSRPRDDRSAALDPVPSGMIEVDREPFVVDVMKGSPHAQVVEDRYGALQDIAGPTVDTVAGEDIINLDTAGSGATLAAYVDEMRLLFGQNPSQTGRYAVVKELPYYHLDEYPLPADLAPLHDYLESDRRNPSKYERQELGDIDVAIFDRQKRRVYHIEVKGNNKRSDLERAQESIDKFAAYASTLGWEVQGEITVFDEEERDLENDRLIGSIVRYAYQPEAEG